MSKISPRIMIEAILKEGSITAAAESLYVSQPYLSKLLRQIEANLGVEIFERQPRSLTITYAGERYLAYLEKIDSVEQEMFVELDMISKQKKGKLKIGINPTLGASILPIIMPSYLNENPQIEIELFEKDANTLETLLEANLIDVAIGMAPIDQERFAYEVLYDDYMHLLVSKESPLYSSQYNSVVKFPYDLSQLNDLPLVLLDKEYGIRRLVDDFYTKYNLKQRVIIETSTIYTAIGLVRQGMGHTFIPATGMSLPLFKQCNVFVFNSDTLKSSFVIFYQKHRTLSPIVKDFIDSTIHRLQNQSEFLQINL